MNPFALILTLVACASPIQATLPEMTDSFDATQNKTTFFAGEYLDPKAKGHVVTLIGSSKGEYATVPTAHTIVIISDAKGAKRNIWPVMDGKTVNMSALTGKGKSIITGTSVGTVLKLTFFNLSLADIRAFARRTKPVKISRYQRNGVLIKVPAAYFRAYLKHIETSLSP